MELTRVNTCFTLILLATAFVLPANAAPIFSIDGASLTASALTQNGSLVGLDVRGAVLLGVHDAGNLIEEIGLLDSTGGTDPNATTLPFGNTVFAAFNSSSLGNPPVAQMTFDLLHPAFLNGGAVLVLGAGADPFAGNVRGDPGLNELVHANPLLFGFGFVSSQTLGQTGMLFQYNLLAVQSEAPEPATVLSLLSGALATGMLRLRKHRPGA